MAGTRTRQPLPYSYADRLVTPATVIVGLVVGGALIAYVLHLTASLARAGVDAAPLFTLLGILVAALGSLGTFVVQLVKSAQQGRIERLAGQTAAALQGATIDVQ
jgi:hypothetical protein